MKVALPLLFTVTLLLGGCASTPEALPPWSSNVSYSGNRLEVVDLQAWEQGNLGLKVMVAVEINDSLPKMKKFRHRILWYTNSGQPIRTTLSYWQNAEEKRGTRQEYAYVAPSPEARSYRVEIEDL